MHPISLILISPLIRHRLQKFRETPGKEHQLAGIIINHIVKFIPFHVKNDLNCESHTDDERRESGLQSLESRLLRLANHFLSKYPSVIKLIHRFCQIN